MSENPIDQKYNQIVRVTTTSVTLLKLARFILVLLAIGGIALLVGGTIHYITDGDEGGLVGTLTGAIVLIVTFVGIRYLNKRIEKLKSSSNSI